MWPYVKLLWPLVIIIIIRLHRSTDYVDVAYFYRPSSMVCRSVCHTSEPCKNAWTDWDAIWVEDSGGSREACIRWGSKFPHGKGQLWGGNGHPIVKSSAVICAKMAQPIEMPFWLRAWMGPRNHVLDGVQIPIERGNFGFSRFRTAHGTVSSGTLVPPPSGRLKSIESFCHEPCKNGWTDRFTVWVVDLGRPKEAQFSHIRQVAPMCTNSIIFARWRQRAWRYCAVRKCLNRSFAVWVGDSGGPKEAQVQSYSPGGAKVPSWEGTLAPPCKYDWTGPLLRRCALCQSNLTTCYLFVMPIQHFDFLPSLK